jgi:hypothetical protein
MTPVRQKFCDGARKLYLEKYKQPSRATDAQIIKLALGYRYTSINDPEIHFLLWDMHDLDNPGG